MTYLSPEIENHLSILFKSFEESPQETIQSALDNDALCNVYHNFLDIKIKWEKTGSDLQKFWLRFIDMVELLLNAILTVRSGDWHLFMTCVKDLIHYALAYDNINYARYLTAMFSEMLTLEEDFPEIYEGFVAGNFTELLSNDGRFSRTELDKVIEMTLNHDKKTRGGTPGFSSNIGAMHRWEINSKYQALLRTAFHQHLDCKSSNYQHKDLAPSRICKDGNNVSALTNVFLETFINPFSDSPMMSISAGIQTAANIPKDLLSAQQLGKTAMVRFIKERLAVGSSKFIFDLIKKS